MRQGAVGQVRLVQVDGRSLVEKRMADPVRHDAEVRALRALAGSGLPVPELVAVSPGTILMTRLPGERLDELDPQRQLDGIAASAALLRDLHALPPPTGLAAAPDDAAVIERYRRAGGPPLPLRVPPPTPAVFCHGDWTNGNLLLTGERVSGVVDWEAAHVGDPVRELARAAWGASLQDPRRFDALVTGYGADPTHVAAWSPLHAAELWLWFREAGPPEYLDDLTRRLRSWPG